MGQWFQLLLLVCLLVCVEASAFGPLRGTSLQYPVISLQPHYYLSRTSTELHGKRAYNSRSGGRRPKRISSSRKQRTVTSGLGKAGATGFLLGANVILYLLTKGIPGLGWLG